MRRFLLGIGFVVCIGAFMLSGCSKKTAQRPAAPPRVAGTQEHYTAAAKSAKNLHHVTVNLTNAGVHVTPSTIPAGNVALTVKNSSNKTQSLAINGQGTKHSLSLKPGQSSTVILTSSKPGAYSVSLQAPTPAQGGAPAKTKPTTTGGSK